MFIHFLIDTRRILKENGKVQVGDVLLFSFHAFSFSDDPPEDGATHLDRHGSPNPFGSWYSMTGNITGEAGLPVGNERSVSFYYQE